MAIGSGRGDTKTPKSRRTMELALRAVSALVGHRERQQVRQRAAGAYWQSLNLVFASEIGTPLDATNVRRAVRKVVKSAGLDPAP